MVQRHTTAVGHQAVNELELVRLQRDGAVAAAQGRLGWRGEPGDLPIENVLLMGGDDAEPPASAAEILGEGIDADGVVRQIGHERAETAHERAVNVVRQDNEVGALRLHQLGDLAEGIALDGKGRRVGRVHHEERLDALVLQLGDLLGGILPGFRVHVRQVIGFDRNHFQIKILQVRHLDIGGKNRHADGDLVALLEEAIRLERVEDVAHGRRAAFDGEEVELPPGRLSAAQLLDQVGVNGLLGVSEHPVGRGVLVADDRVGKFVNEGIRVEPQLLDAVIHGFAQELDARPVWIPPHPGIKARGNAVLLGHPGQVEQVQRAFGFLDRELAEREEGFARGGGGPVGIAPSGVEEERRIARRGFLGGGDEKILQFERAEFCQRAHARAGGVVCIWFRHNGLLLH